MSHQNRILNIQMVALYTMIRKEMIRIFRIWPQTFLPSIITTTLYFLIFGKFIGSQIDNISGFSYMQYIVPGLVMMSVITGSFTSVVFSYFGSKFMRNLEEILVAPVAYSTIIAGFVFSGVLRALIVGAATMVISLFFTNLVITHVWAVMFFILLTSIMFALAGLVNAIYARTFDDTSIVMTFFLTPLTYLGGVFYSISMLSAFWQNISLFNPVLYMMNGFRFGFLGITDINIYYCAGVTIVFSLIFFFWSIYLFKSKRAVRV